MSILSHGLGSGECCDDGVAAFNEGEEVDRCFPAYALLEVLVAEDPWFEVLLVGVPALIAIQYDVFRVDDFVTGLPQHKGLSSRHLHVLGGSSDLFFQDCALGAQLVRVTETSESYRHGGLQENADDLCGLKIVPQALPWGKSSMSVSLARCLLVWK